MEASAEGAAFKGEGDDAAEEAAKEGEADVDAAALVGVVADAVDVRVCCEGCGERDCCCGCG